MLPPVVSRQLVALSHSHFCIIVATHRDRGCVETTRINTMEQEHKDLDRAIVNEPALRSSVEACKDLVSFDGGWSVLKGLFESLKFCAGGSASVFPGTSQVESEFSIIMAAKYDLRTSITDLSLVLHCKQFSMLASL